jgi:hypothetical protein
VSNLADVIVRAFFRGLAYRAAWGLSPRTAAIILITALVVLWAMGVTPRVH